MKVSVLATTIISCAVFKVTAAAAVDTNRAHPGRHVVIVVWDGMRPDLVSEVNTPVLWKLAKNGVVFRNHHAAYPSATNVNGAVMMTGVYPASSGIIANHEFRPDLNSLTVVDTTEPPVVRKGDEVSGNAYLAVPTLAELVRKSGGHTIIAGAKTIGALLDRQTESFAASRSVTIFAGNAVPALEMMQFIRALGPFPNHYRQHIEQDLWTTNAIRRLWEWELPPLSVLWLGDPDLAQHQTAPGAPAAMAAIKSSDDNLGRVLAELERYHASDTTDIFVVSDHGFSTIDRSIDLQSILNTAGFDAVTNFAEQDVIRFLALDRVELNAAAIAATLPKAGQILMAGNGGAVLFYIIGHDGSVVHRLVEFLQQSDFAGVIFAREKMEGTFAFDSAEINGARAPDVEMSFRWNDHVNRFGVAGMIDADWQREAGKGTHATLSHFDMHNTLVAAGPDFRRGYEDNSPTGNVDLAPTVLRLVAIPPPQKLNGRVLAEAFNGGKIVEPGVQTKILEATKKFPSGTWRQTLKVSTAGSTVYLDEGNGEFRP